MKHVTIHTYDTTWKGAQIIGTGLDTLMGAEAVFLVRHAAFERDIDFYAEPDEQGRYHSVGNRAFWMTMDQ